MSNNQYNSWEEQADQDENLAQQAGQMNLGNNQQQQQQGGFRPAIPSFTPGAAAFTPGAATFQPGQAYGGYPQGQYNQYSQYGQQPQQQQQQQYGGGYGGVYGQQQGGYYSMSRLLSFS